MELCRIAELAKQDAGRKFHSLAHLRTQEALWEAFDALRKDTAAGVDGVTYADYEEHLVENLCKLHEKLKSGTYRAQPLRRIYIDKEDGRKRPISIPSLEDKIVQRATVELPDEPTAIVPHGGVSEERGWQHPRLLGPSVTDQAARKQESPGPT